MYIHSLPYYSLPNDISVVLHVLVIVIGMYIIGAIMSGTVLCY